MLRSSDPAQRPPMPELLLHLISNRNYRCFWKKKKKGKQTMTTKKVPNFPLAPPADQGKRKKACSILSFKYLVSADS